MTVLCIGGTGVISRALVGQLIEAGHHVTVITRGNTGAPHDSAEWIQRDRHDLQGLAVALADRRFDAVVDMICYGVADAKDTLRLIGDRADHLIMVSSVAAYRRPLANVPTSEDSEELWTVPDYEYGFQKAEMERFLGGRAGSGIPVTLVRPSLTFGAGSRNFGVLRQNLGLVQRIRSGKPVVLFDDGSCPWTFSFAPDIAAAMIPLICNPKAYGKAVHLASDEVTTWRDFYLALGRVAGAEPDIRYLPTRRLWEADPERFGHIFYEKSHPGLYDLTRLRSLAPEYRRRTSLEDGLAALVQSWKDDGLNADPELDAFEDRLGRIAGPPTPPEYRITADAT